MADHDPVTTSLLTVAPDGSFSGEIQFGSAAGGMLALRGPSALDDQSLTFPAEMPNNGDYLRSNASGQLFWDAGCSACGGTNGGGFTDPGVNGIIVRSGPDTYVSRSIVGQYPISVVNGDGANGNPTIGLVPGSSNGQVLTWNATIARWEPGAGGTAPPGSGSGTPNVLTRWASPAGTSVIDSALSQDATGTTVSAGGAFVVSGRLKLNNLLEMPTPTLPIAPPTGEPSKALMYYQGGAVPFWVSYSATAIGVAGGWQPINAFMIGRVPGGSFGLTNKISVGRTGMLIGDRDTTNTGFGPFDSEIYLAPLTSASTDVGKAIVWDGSHWVASPAPIGLAGTGVTVGGSGGTINVFPVFSASNILINSSPTGATTGGVGGLIQGPIGGGSLNWFLQSHYDIFVSDNAIRLGSYLRMDGAFTSVAQSDPGTLRLWYNYLSFPDTLLVSFNNGQYQAINAITMAQPGKTPITSSVWTLTPPLQSLRSGSDIILRIAPPPVNLTAGQVLTWDGAQWTAAAPGSTSGAITTPGSNALGQIAMWTGTNTLSFSSLFQGGTGDISTSKALIAGSWVQSGTNGYVGFKTFNLPTGPNNNIRSNSGEARIAFYNGQLLASINTSDYLPLGGGGVSGSGNNLTIPMWTGTVNPTAALTNSSLTQDSGGWVYVALGMSLAQKVRTAQWIEFAPPSVGQPLPGAAFGEALILYNRANARFEYSVNGGSLLPLVGTGGGISAVAPTTGTKLTRWSSAGLSITDANITDNGSVLTFGLAATPYSVLPFAGTAVDLGTNAQAFHNLVCSNVVCGTLQAYPSGSGGSIALTGSILPAGGDGLYDLGGTGAYFRQIAGIKFVAGNGNLAQPAITLQDRSIGLYTTSPNQIVMGVQNIQAMAWFSDVNNPVYINVGGSLKQVQMGAVNSGGTGIRNLVVVSS